MSEKAIQQALGEAIGFAERQKLLKQLWKLRREREVEAEGKTIAAAGRLPVEAKESSDAGIQVA